MPRNGSGGYSPPLNNWNPAIIGGAATPADWQALLDDMAAALQASTAADGQTPITGVWNFGNNRISGVGAPIGVGNALRWEQLTKGTDIASATTITIPNEGSLFEITGTTGIATINDTYPGRTVLLRFQDAVALTHSSNLVLPTGADITTAAGDLAMFVNTDVGVWSVAFYSNAKGVGYDPTGTGRTATNVQDAISEGDLILGTSVSASGSAVDFTGIPSTSKRICVMFMGVSTDGISGYSLQLGHSGGFETSGYSGASTTIPNGSSPSVVNMSSSFTLLGTNPTAATIFNGQLTLSKVDENTWAISSVLSVSSTQAMIMAAGVKELSAALTQVRITTNSGADSFDAGTINISWE